MFIITDFNREAYNNIKKNMQDIFSEFPKKFYKYCFNLIEEDFPAEYEIKKRTKNFSSSFYSYSRKRRILFFDEKGYFKTAFNILFEDLTKERMKKAVDGYIKRASSKNSSFVLGIYFFSFYKEREEILEEILKNKKKRKLFFDFLRYFIFFSEGELLSVSRNDGCKSLVLSAIFVDIIFSITDYSEKNKLLFSKEEKKDISFIIKKNVEIASKNEFTRTSFVGPSFESGSFSSIFSSEKSFSDFFKNFEENLKKIIKIFRVKLEKINNCFLFSFYNKCWYPYSDSNYSDFNIDKSLKKGNFDWIKKDILMEQEKKVILNFSRSIERRYKRITKKRRNELIEEIKEMNKNINVLKYKDQFKPELEDIILEAMV